MWVIIPNGLLPPSCAVFAHLRTVMVNPSRPLSLPVTGWLVHVIHLRTRMNLPLPMVSTCPHYSLYLVLYCVVDLIFVICLNDLNFVMYCD